VARDFILGARMNGEEIEWDRLEVFKGQARFSPFRLPILKLLFELYQNFFCLRRPGGSFKKPRSKKERYYLSE